MAKKLPTVSIADGELATSPAECAYCGRPGTCLTPFHGQKSHLRAHPHCIGKMNATARLSNK